VIACRLSRGACPAGCRWRGLVWVVGCLVLVGLLFGGCVGVAWGHPAWRFERRFGSSGSGAGQLSLVGFDGGSGAGSGVGVSLVSGDVYVADTGNDRVDVFSASGAFVLAFGKGVDVSTGGDVCTAVSEDTCGPGVEGSAAGELALPVFVAVDNSCALHKPVLAGSECEAFDPSDGDVYVASAGDPVDERVSKFTAGGVLVSSWGSGGQLDGSSVLAEGTGDLTAGSGEVTNVHTTNGSFEAFQTLVGEGIPAAAKIGEVSASSLVLREKLAEATKSGVALSARFVFTELGGIAVDANGNLWVYSADGDGNGRMLEFERNGTFVKAWKSPIGVVSAGIAVAPPTSAPTAGSLFVNAGLGVEELTTSGTRVGLVENVVGNHGVVTGLGFGAGLGDLFVDSSADRASPGLEVRVFPGSCEGEDPGCVVCEPTLEVECVPEEGFGGSGEPVGDRLVDGQGVAVGLHEQVLVADAGDDSVVAFEEVQLANVVSGEAVGLSEAEGVLQGTVNPAGVPVSECFFEYGPGGPGEASPRYGERVACEQSVGAIGSGTQAVAVTAKVPLSVGALYHFRLVAVNANGAERGGDRVFGASVGSSLVVSASETTAAVSTKMNPDGYPTSCSLQYVSEAVFMAEGFNHAASVGCVTPDVGSGTSPVGVEAVVSGLEAGVAYRFRFVAKVSGAAGERATIGGEGVFATYPRIVFPPCGNGVLRGEDGSNSLPDCRAFERVSSPDNSEVYTTSLPQHPEDGVSSALALSQASPQGGGVVYVGEAASAGEGNGTGNVGGGEGDEHIATRTASGWESVDIEPDGAGPGTVYEDFGAGLEAGVVRTGLANEPVPSPMLAGCLYSRETEGERSIVPVLAGADCGEPFVVGMAEGGAGVVFESRAAVAGTGAKEAEPLKQPDPAKGEPGNVGHENVYDYSSEAGVHLVNVLPNGSPAAADATAGSLSSEPALITLSGTTPAVSVNGVVSVDGSRVFWTDLASGVVYVRLNPLATQSRLSGGKCTQPADACTVQVSAGAAMYWAASAEGVYAYYVEGGELWRFDTETGVREAVAGAGAGVQGVIGVNQTGPEGADGFVYFVAEGALAEHAEHRSCQPASEPQEVEQEEEGLAPVGRGCNLYVTHEDKTSLVAVLLAGDDAFAGTTLGNPQPLRGDWSRVLGYRSAQLTPGGGALVFTSEAGLTGYDNVNTGNECGHPVHACAEVYEYRYDGGGVVCVSCVPSGVAPAGASDTRAEGMFLPFEQASVVHSPRVVSGDGSRVFFDARFPLTPGGGTHMGVFEWEAAGSGSCVEGSPFDGGGCLYLLAGGEVGPAYLTESDESGDNVFFVARGGRIPGVSSGEVPGLFDARVDGGFPEPLEGVPCGSVEGCHVSWPPVPPVFSPFGSGTSPGNFPFANPGPPSSSPPSHLTPRGRLERALAGCRRDRVRRRRVACERGARARYEREVHKGVVGRKGRKAGKGRGAGRRGRVSRGAKVGRWGR
jgi:hypothetical protein